VRTYGISKYSHTSSGYQFTLGTRPADMSGTPTDGYVKTSLW